MPRGKLTTAQQGMDWRTHRRAADALKALHDDGTLCDWCQRPMWRDRTRNWDYNPDSTYPYSGALAADHSTISRAECIRRGVTPPPPDRLLHGACNIQRGEGSNDHLAANAPPPDQLVMPWPWAR